MAGKNKSSRDECLQLQESECDSHSRLVREFVQDDCNAFWIDIEDVELFLSGQQHPHAQRLGVPLANLDAAIWHLEFVATAAILAIVDAFASCEQSIEMR